MVAVGPYNRRILHSRLVLLGQFLIIVLLALWNIAYKNDQSTIQPSLDLPVTLPSCSPDSTLNGDRLLKPEDALPIVPDFAASRDDPNSNITWTTVYSVLRPDRSGSVIAAVIRAHAAVHRENRVRLTSNRTAHNLLVYGGACSMARHIKRMKPKAHVGTVKDSNPTLDELKALIKTLRLDHLFRDPDTPFTPCDSLRNSQDTILWLNANAYSLTYDALLTPDWYRLIQPPRLTHNSRNATTSGSESYHSAQVLALPQVLARGSSDDSSGDSANASDMPQHQTRAKQIAMFIRRGDIEPCDRQFGFRYLTNAYYGELWGYVQQTFFANVSDPIHLNIIAQSDSFEPWSDMEQVIANRTLPSIKDRLSVKLRLDEPVDTVMTFMAFEADMIILSRSSFAYLPALLNTQATVVYTPFFYDPLSRWHIVPDWLENANSEPLDRFRREICLAEGREEKQHWDKGL
jgi:hypothetical protein